MKAPAFWNAAPSDPLGRLLAAALTPASALVGVLAARRLVRPGDSVPAPVVCVGNFTAGGAGKTPTALALAATLVAAGRQPFFLSRGYGGRRGAVPHRVNLLCDTAAEVGDEPLLLARAAPVIVARDRRAGAKVALAAGADCLVMDDGLQNPGLSKTVSLAVVDAGAGFGNGRVLPAGPLRAPLAAQWPLVRALIVIGAGAPGDEAARLAERAGVRVLRGRLAPDPDCAAALAGQRVVAFAGIGRPAKFFASLTEIGADIVAWEGFGDHRPYRASTLARLAAEAQRAGAILVTTEKDAVRIGAAALAALPVACAILPVRFAPDDPAAFAALIGSAFLPA
jgi:tetraacyldisaccharide 4'-kinase